MFGPMNFGVSEKEAEARARELVSLVGLPNNVLEKSPFDLSGGQMRRVAIAGVLAMDPEVIVLDEPTAGLDPRGQKRSWICFINSIKIVVLQRFLSHIVWRMRLDMQIIL